MNLRFSFKFFIFFILLSVNKSFAQYENVWVMGYKAGLDFNSGVPVSIETNIASYIPRPSSWDQFEASASVCDSIGELLFYTDGTYVWDKNHNLMPNGSLLIPEPAIFTYAPTHSCTQGTIIVPIPGNSMKYYIFSQNSGEAGALSGRLHYSIVDMTLNGGLGDIIADQKGILIDSNGRENMIAVEGPYCNIWLLTASKYAPYVIKAFEITNKGIDISPVISNIINDAINFYGSFAISPNRKMLVMTNGFSGDAGFVNTDTNLNGGATLFEFDVFSGTVKNPIYLLAPDTGAYSTCFSPDNSKLYLQSVAEGGIIFQYDLSSGIRSEIISSKTLIGRTYFAPAQLKLAPDGKIYFPMGYRTLGAIEFPNLSGDSAQFNSSAVELLPSATLNMGLPNRIAMIRIDTFYSSQHITFPCFAKAPALYPVDTSGSDYIWNDGSTGIKKLVEKSGTYYVKYNKTRCYTKTDTFHVIVRSGFIKDLHIQSTCGDKNNGAAYIIIDGSDDYSATWRSSLDTTTLSRTDSLTKVPAGHYSVRITTPSGCDTTLFFHIPEEDYQVSFEADTIICEGDTLQFNNTSDPHFQSFSWDFGDGRQSDLKHPTNSYANAGSYDITLIGRGEVCTDTAYQRIVVDPQLPLSFYAEPDSICAGEAVYFYPRTDGSTLGLHWQFGDGAEMGGPNERMVRHAYEHDGVMTVIMRGRYRACPGQEYRDSVYVYPLPEIDLGTDDSLCLNGRPIVLENLRRAPAGRLKYLWSTGDTSARIKVVYPGVYSLKVSAPPLGCTSTESVEVKKDCYIDIPNAFTPNGDGENDYFFPRQLLSGSVIAFRMQVFNRWGQVVFESTAADGRGWDGRFNGKEQPVGVYVYLVDVEFANGKQERYEGNVTLLR